MQPSHGATCHPSRHAPELAANLVSKGLSARPKTVAKASEALLLLVGLAAAEPVVVRGPPRRTHRRGRRRDDTQCPHARV